MALVKLPLFPLNIVVLPFEEVPLHIFEPRYEQMVKYSIAQGKPFGIVFKDDKDIDTLGCSVEITKVIKTYTCDWEKTIQDNEQNKKGGTMDRKCRIFPRSSVNR